MAEKMVPPGPDDGEIDTADITGGDFFSISGSSVARIANRQQNTFADLVSVLALGDRLCIQPQTKVPPCRQGFCIKPPVCSVVGLESTLSFTDNYAFGAETRALLYTNPSRVARAAEVRALELCYGVIESP